VLLQQDTALLLSWTAPDMANPVKKRSLSPANDQVDSSASNEGWTTVSANARKKPKKEKLKKGQVSGSSTSNAKSHAQIIDEAVRSLSRLPTFEQH
jgi:ribosome assembly protein YihI (activator of Der GTPase)